MAKTIFCLFVLLSNLFWGGDKTYSVKGNVKKKQKKCQEGKNNRNRFDSC